MLSETKASKSPVIIIGTNITSLGVIRGLRESNVTIYTVSDDSSGLGGMSKYVHSDVIIDSGSADYASLVIDWIRNTFQSKPIVMIAGHDVALSLLSKEHALLRKYAIPTFPEWNIVKGIVHKEKTNELAKELNIPIIKTESIKNKSELNSYLNSIGESDYPLFMKCTLSSQFLKLYGTKGVVCHGREEVVLAYNKYDGFLENLLLQEYLLGDLDEVLAVLMVLNKDSEVVAVSANKKIRASKPYGSTSLSSSTWDQSVVENAVKLAEASRYVGTVGVQFKFDPKVGEYKFLEINGRFSVSVSLSQRCGVNLPDIVYKVFTSNDQKRLEEFTRAYQDNILLWWPVDDFRILFQKRFYKNPWKYIKSLKGNGYIIEPINVGDPGPLLKMIYLPILAIVKKFL